MNPINNKIINFNIDKSAEYLEEDLSTTILYKTGSSLYNLESKFQITQNGYFGFFNFRVCLRGGLTKPQLDLKKFEELSSKYKFNKNKLFISNTGKVYSLWGFIKKRSKNPFVLTNVSNMSDKILMDHDNVFKYFI